MGKYFFLKSSQEGRIKCTERLHERMFEKIPNDGRDDCLEEKLGYIES